MPQNTGHTPPASEAEKVLLWDSFETFQFTSSRAHIHLYERCDYLDAPTEKPAAVFPVGFKPLCSWCLSEWRTVEK
jgi:hypothetical protein